MEERAEETGEEVHQYIKNVFDSDEVLSKLRVVQNIVTLLETYPNSRAQRACQRADHYGNYRYLGIKNILNQGLENKDLPEVEKFSPHPEPPKFARQPSEFILNNLELFPDNTGENQHGYH